MGMWKNSWKI